MAMSAFRPDNGETPNPLLDSVQTLTISLSDSQQNGLQCKICFNFDSLVKNYLIFSLDSMLLDSEVDADELQAGQRAEVLALVEAAVKQGLPYDYYLSLAAKRGASTLGALGYDELMSQPRSISRETRDDGRRYLMWRKITG